MTEMFRWWIPGKITTIDVDGWSKAELAEYIDALSSGDLKDLIERMSVGEVDTLLENVGSDMYKKMPQYAKDKAKTRPDKERWYEAPWPRTVKTPYDPNYVAMVVQKKDTK